MSKFECRKCGGDVRKYGRTPGGKQLWSCKLCKFRTTSPPAAGTFADKLAAPALISSRLSDLRKTRDTTKVQRYVVTSAQNNTTLNLPFFNSLLTYCKHNNAELLVIPIRYKNPTGWDTRHTDEDYWYPVEVLPYLVDRELILNKNLTVRGDIKIQATAVDPVTGLDTISGTRSAIFGHSQIRMKMVATPQDRLPKMLHTSGSISARNYSSTKQGAKGKHHHSMAALVVEVVEDLFNIREVKAGTGGAFYDLDKLYSVGGVTEGHTIAALVVGDEHEMFMSPGVKEATFTNEDSIVNSLKPDKIVRHDIIDFYCQNHHHWGNRLIRYVKAAHGRDDVRAELDSMLRMLDETTPDFAESLIVSSNHNEALMRWLNEYRPERDPLNAAIYHELCHIVYSEAVWSTTGPSGPDPLEVYSRGKLKCKHRFLSNRKSELIKGIDVSQHGHRGANGARGSINSFAVSEYKMVVGHSHSPGIKFGCYQVGTSSLLQLEYNQGLSSWMNTHCIIYPNGKRSLIHIINGKWRA